MRSWEGEVICSDEEKLPGERDVQHGEDDGVAGRLKVEGDAKVLRRK